MPPQIPGQLKSCYSCGLERGQASVSVCVCVCLHKMSCRKGFKMHGSQWHGGRTLEAQFAAKSTSQEHEFWGLQTCKHHRRLTFANSVCRGLFPRIDVLIRCFWFIKLTENKMKNNTINTQTRLNETRTQKGTNSNWEIRTIYLVLNRLGIPNTILYSGFIHFF